MNIIIMIVKIIGAMINAGLWLANGYRLVATANTQIDCIR